MPAPIQFVLDSLSDSTTLDLSGEFLRYDPVLDVSATAIFEIDVNTVKSVFQIESDSYQFSDLSNADIKYYVFSQHWPHGTDGSFNPANAMLSYSSSNGGVNSAGAIASTETNGSPIPANKMMVCHDFVRYLAQQLFGTHMGVDLFANQVTLLQHLRELCGPSGIWQDIVAKVELVSATGTHTLLQTDSSGNKYMSNNDISLDNLSRVLLQQMMEYGPERFNGYIATGSPQALPFVAGDSISLKLTIHPAPDQNLLTGVSTIGPRSYSITLDIVDNSGVIVNTPVDPLETGAQNS